MRINRFFTPQTLAAGQQLELETACCRRLSQVLRLKPGSPLVLFNGDGHDYSASLLEAGKRGCRVTIEVQGPPETPAALDIRLGLGISKPEHMDIAVQKSVELGVSAIQPVLCDFSNQKQTGDWRAKKTQHWHNIIISACEQSGQRRLPSLLPITESHAWLQGLPPDPLCLLLDPGADRGIGQLQQPADDQAILLLVGPEGGLSPAEVEGAKATGFIGVRLGPRVLRTETAPLAAIAALQTLWGDFRR